MNFNDFFTHSDFEKAKHAVDNKQPFKLEIKCKKQEIEIESLIVNKHTANGIWNGINYLISVNKWNGTSGSGYATTDYSMFDDFNSFIKFVDSTLKGAEDYQTSENVEQQLSWF